MSTDDLNFNWRARGELIGDLLKLAANLRLLERRIELLLDRREVA